MPSKRKKVLYTHANRWYPTRREARIIAAAMELTGNKWQTQVLLWAEANGLDPQHCSVAMTYGRIETAHGEPLAKTAYR